MTPQDQQELEALRRQIAALGGNPDAVLGAAQGQPVNVQAGANAQSNAQMAAALAGGSVGAIRANPKIASDAAGAGVAARQPSDPRTTGERVADAAGKMRKKFQQAPRERKFQYTPELYNRLKLGL